MEINFKRENSGSYMEICGEPETDSFEMKMMCSNNITGFLPVSVRQINNKAIYMYNITGKNNIRECYAKDKISGRNLYSLIECLKNILRQTENYILNEAGLRLAPEYIYKDINSDTYYFTYFPEEGRTLWEELKELFEFIITVVAHTDNEAVTIAYGIYKRLCTNVTSIEELFKIEHTQEPEKYEVKTETIVQKEIIPEVREEEKEVEDKLKKYMVFAGIGGLGAISMIFLFFLLSGNARPKMLSGAFCGIVCAVFGTGSYYLYYWYGKHKSEFTKIITEEVAIPYTRDNVRITVPEKKENNLTTILSSDMPLKPMLQWQEGGLLRKYNVEDDTVIGSSAEKADCVVEGNGISRIHAKIIKEDSVYYIKDLNSTNGTRVNGELLATYRLMPLSVNDRITVGNIDLIFH